jgi:hypothetical protein
MNWAGGYRPIHCPRQQHTRKRQGSCTRVRHKEPAHGVKYLFMNQDLNEITLKQFMKQDVRQKTTKLKPSALPMIN